LYVLHNSSHISLFSKDYREVMGGAYIDHPPLHPFRVSVVNNEHPITRGVEDFMVNDEQHFVTYDKDSKDILLPRSLHRGRPYASRFVAARVLQATEECS